MQAGSRRITRPLAITFLVEEATEPWGGVQTLLRDSEALAARGHHVVVLCKSPRPGWFDGAINYRQVPGFDRDFVPRSDLVIGTYCSTIPAALRSGRGRAVHYCQGYEGDSPRNCRTLHLIESIYRMRGVAHLAISPHVAAELEARFGFRSIVVPNGIRSELFRPAERDSTPPLRVGLVGPWERPWTDSGKDIPTGIRACRELHASGVDVLLVRSSMQPVSAEEKEAWGDLPVEWHEKESIEGMAELYRSLDVYLGTSRAEGFFLPAVEAMASGVPCVLTDIPCFRGYDAVQDYALFAPPGNSHVIAERIAELHEDPDQRAALGRRGLEVASRYTFERHVDALEGALESLVPEGSSLVERKRGDRPLEWNDEWSSYEENAKDGLLYQILDALAWAWDTKDVSWARELASTATRLFSDSPDLWQSLGRIHVHENDWKEAERAFLEAMALCPESPAIHDSLGRVRCEQERYPDAVRHFEAAIRFGMPGDGIRVDLAKALWNAGAFGEAERVLRETIRLYPDSLEAVKLAGCLSGGLSQASRGLLVRKR